MGEAGACQVKGLARLVEAGAGGIDLFAAGSPVHELLPGPDLVQLCLGRVAGSLCRIEIAPGDHLAPEERLLTGKVGLQSVGIGLGPLDGCVSLGDFLPPEAGFQFAQLGRQRLCLPFLPGHFKAQFIVVQPRHHLARPDHHAFIHQAFAHRARYLEAQLHIGDLDVARNPDDVIHSAVAAQEQGGNHGRRQENRRGNE